MVIFSCVNGYGWIIADFFSMKIWVPLSRLTYGVSLVHPFIIESKTSAMFEDRTLIIYTISIVVLSYTTAGILAIFVEFPLANIESSLFKLFGLHQEESVRLVNFELKGKKT